MDLRGRDKANRMGRRADIDLEETGRIEDDSRFGLN